MSRVFSRHAHLPAKDLLPANLSSDDIATYREEGKEVKNFKGLGQGSSFWGWRYFTDYNSSIMYHVNGNTYPPPAPRHIIILVKVPRIIYKWMLRIKSMIMQPALMFTIWYTCLAVKRLQEHNVFFSVYIIVLSEWLFIWLFENHNQITI